MRYQLNEEIFAVHFNYQTAGGLKDAFFRQPYMYSDLPVLKINFTKLTVVEHHKVLWDYDAEDAAPKYDGYLLQDVAGGMFANQFPKASYGQTTDTGNRRFHKHYPEPVNVKEESSKENFIYEYHLLSEVLETMVRGIKELSELTEEHKRYVEAQEKVKLLEELYERVFVQFHSTYPEYTLTMVWRPPFEGSSLLWPEVLITKKETNA